MLIKTLVRGTLDVKDHKIVRVQKTCMGIQVHIDRNKRQRLPCSQGGTLAVDPDVAGSNPVGLVG